MKIPIVDLTLENLQLLKEQNDWSDHFNVVVWPRVLFWLGIKEQFKEYTSLDWKIHFTPDNMHNNFISMHIRDDQDVFNFYFQVPLVEKLTFNLYLGDSTYNFFEIHPFLIDRKIIKKDEYQIQATSNILPHLVLSSESTKYDKAVLWEIDESSYLKAVANDPIINTLVAGFRKFISPLEKIIKGEWEL